MTEQSPVEVEPGQYWNLSKNLPARDSRTDSPRRIRILCLYPDSAAGVDIWVVETTTAIEEIWRIPERTLRVYYELDEKGAL